MTVVLDNTMATTPLQLFQLLSSFQPKKTDLADAPWDAYVDWAIAEGLGPLAAYNLEYKLGQCRAPQWAKDRLLSVYQAVANDNVMKLVNFKRTLAELEGRRLVVLGAACFAESLYPHVAFRPVAELSLWVTPADVAPLVGYLGHAGFAKVSESDSLVTLSDTRSTLLIYRVIFGQALDESVLADAEPMPVYGPSLYRLPLEAALAVEARLAEQAEYQLPRIVLVDVRELLLGAPMMGGFYSRHLDAPRLSSLLTRLNCTTAAFTLFEATRRLFEETQAQVSSLALSAPSGLAGLQADVYLKSLTSMP
jgi:Uncharacterised nucleotidyltransferase